MAVRGGNGGVPLHQSPVVSLVAYFGVREVAKIEVLRSRVKESEWTRGD